MAVILPLLPDRVRLPVRVLFVGINPGMRSAATGHHFAGYSNRFWKLLFESGLLPVPIGAQDDDRLTEWGYGITNLVPRATPGIDTLTPAEYAAGLRVLRRKVRRWKPDFVALVGVTLYRAICGRKPPAPASVGLQSERFEGSRLFVLPNPSGRNANFSYDEMLAAFRGLRALARDSGQAEATKAASRAAGTARRASKPRRTVTRAKGPA